MGEHQATGPRIYEFKALSSLWTGDIDGKPGRLITTGLLGSIRWWFEVVVRGFGGFACDPSARQKCCLDREHCVVCELFGCTGWARKFRFDVLDTNGRPRHAQITKGAKFKLRFTPLRSICDKEWALLDLTLRLIADYGAIGGKTVFKPTEEAHRKGAQHHQDYGLVAICSRPEVPEFSREALERYATRDEWRRGSDNGSAWASLEHFWFVERRLARTSSNSSPFNRVIGREEPKGQAQNVSSNGKSQWLAGSTGNSKKVFSFSDPQRTFGFVKPGTISHEEMKDRLKKAWPDLADGDYQTGNHILGRLLLPSVEALS